MAMILTSFLLYFCFIIASFATICPVNGTADDSLFFSILNGCTKYSTMAGGVTITLLLWGDSINENRTISASLELRQHRKIQQPFGQITKVTNLNRTNCSMESNKFFCPAPTLETFSDRSPFSATIPPCQMMNSSSDITSSNETCFRFLLDGDEIPPQDDEVHIFYYKDPIFMSATFSGRQHLSLTGEAGVSLWVKTSGCWQISGINSVGEIFKITIGANNTKCSVNWEESNDTQLDCTIDLSSNAADLLGQMITIPIGFNKIRLPITLPTVIEGGLPSWTRSLAFLVPVIVVPIVALLSGCVTLVVCLLCRRYRSPATTSPQLNNNDQQQPENCCQSVVIPFDDLEPLLRSQVKPLLLDEKDFALGSMIDHGFFGEVWSAVMRTKNGLLFRVAVKFLKGNRSSKDFCDFLREAINMCRFKHKNVLECFGVFWSADNKVALVVPFMENSDLRRYVTNNPNDVGLAEVVDFSLQVAEGMRYLSGLDYVHRDLAARNCLIDSFHAVKISDFGLSRAITGSSEYYKVSSESARPMPIRWMAPESLVAGRFTTKTDVWSFGILMWELCTKGGFPFAELESDVVLKRVSGGYFPERAGDIPESLYEIMCRCWILEPSQRASFVELVEILSELKAKTPKPESPNYLQITRDDDYLLPNLSNNNAGDDEYHQIVITESPAPSGRATPTISNLSRQVGANSNAGSNRSSITVTSKKSSAAANYYHHHDHSPSTQSSQKQIRNADTIIALRNLNGISKK